jgi:hypothetical protein
MSGFNSCAEAAAIHERKKNNRKVNSTMNAVSTMGISKLYEKDPPTEPSLNIINNNYQEIKKKINENRCANISNIKQYNIFEQPTECYDSINRTCINNITGIPDIECLNLAYEILDKSSSKPITQSNINKIMSTCEINSALQVLSEKDQTEDNLATIKLLQDARSKAENRKGEDFNCTQIDTNITKEKYINAFLKCANRTSVNQENILSSCTPNISLQLNQNNQMNRCLMDSGIMSEDKVPSESRTVIFDNIYNPITKRNTTTPNITTPNITTPNPSQTTPIINKDIPMNIIIIVAGVVLLVIILLLIYL